MCTFTLKWWEILPERATYQITHTIEAHAESYFLIPKAVKNANKKLQVECNLKGFFFLVNFKIIL